MSAVNPAGQLLGLFAVPVDSAPNPDQARVLATREHDALAALAVKDRTWRVQDWFDWEGYRVTPIAVAMDGTSLGKLAVMERPAHDSLGRVPPEIGVDVVHDAFEALASAAARMVGGADAWVAARARELLARAPASPAPDPRPTDR